MNPENEKNDALKAEQEHKTAVESAADYVENFDILETITNVGNDEVFTPRKTCNMMLDSLPEEVWHNPNYKWLNPASKNGVFEREIAIRLDEGLKNVIPDDEERRKHILQKMIFSIGQTMFTANVARRTVYYCSQANRKCDGIKAPDGHYVNGYAIGNGTWFDDEEGNIKTPNTNHAIDPKTKICKYCGIKSNSKYLDANQLETYAYEFIHVDKKDLLNHLQGRFFKGDRTMKFDIIIGNPPYQLSDGGSGNGASAMPIYQHFIEQAISLNPKYLCMIIPSRWFAGGKGLDDFRSSMLNDHHLSLLVDYVNAKDCFPTSSISGGVCFFLWDRDYSGCCLYKNIHDGKVSVKERYLNEFPVFIRYNEAISIIRKVASFKEPSMSTYVSTRNPFGIPSSFRGASNKTGSNDILVYSSGGVGYSKRKDIKQGKQILSLYKLAISKLTSEHAGEPSSDGTFTVISTIKILKPNEACTDSYMLIYQDADLKKVESCLSYLKTKFFRFLLLQAVSSINLSRDKFALIPAQEFSQIYTDKYLYVKYGLSNEEIAFIESLIKEKVQ